MQKWIALLCLSTLALLGSQLQAQVNQLPAESTSHVYRIGMPLVHDGEVTARLWQPLVDYLNQQQSPAQSFELVVLDLQALDTALDQGELDFIFTNPSLYVLYSYRYGLSSPLATLLNKEQGQSVSQFAGIIFSRADRSDLRQLADLKGKRIATVSRQSLATFQMQAVELKRQGISPTDEIELLETGLPLRSVIDAVMSREADAGFMRAGVLEQLQAEGLLEVGSYKLIGSQQQPGFPLMTSTSLYPEWPFAALPHTAPDVVRLVTASLLSLPANSEVAQQLGIAGFTIPGDYRGIDRLLRDLRLPPFDQQAIFTLQEIWAQWQLYWVLLLIGAAAFLIASILILRHKNRHLAVSQQCNQQITEQLRQNELLLNHAQHVACIGSWDYDPETGLFNCTEQMRLMFGLSEDQPICLDDFMAQIIPEDIDHTQQSWNQALAGQEYELDYRVRLGSDVRWLHEKLHIIRNSHGEMVRLMGTVQDVTDKVEYEQHIESLAFNDALTKIPNRAWLQEQLQDVLQDRAEQPYSALLILLNIDRFKTINNARGSRFGDALLIAVGQRLSQCKLFGVEVEVARVAGDEFAILVQSDRLADMQVTALEITLADHCSQTFDAPFLIDDEPISISISSGVTRFPEEDDLITAELVFQRASMALTHSRLEGGGQLTFFESPMSEAAGYRFRLERDLNRALEQNQLRLFMQPQFDGQGYKRAAELLLRWEHPELGMISPADFIPIAESSNLIVDLDIWVMDQACSLMQQAKVMGITLHLAVNISPRHFCNQAFVPWMKAVLEQQGVNPEQLMLEVTEGLFLNDIDSVSAKMQELRQLGLRFSIDDFGTGYSSLAYLKRLPVSEIKIDRSFVQDAPKEPDDAALIEAILAVADKMQLQVVAEGVETLEQAEFLKVRSETILFQGYFYGRPAPVQDWLTRWQENTLQSCT
ncbi:EAL domain-containing protein [Nitrincola sp.]|uniref:EAL domain-containing protein n=1 Tax=Nitrincola sp. TaxID=1926584 RepID=UPI003A95248C